MKLYEEVAFELHEVWRAASKKGDGIYEECWKKIEDEDFIKRIQAGEIKGDYIRVNLLGEYELDTNNACFCQLSADLQEESTKAAKEILKICEKYRNKGVSLDEIGGALHSAWLERNAWAKDTHLDKEFKKLSKEEKELSLREFKIGLDMSSAIDMNTYAIGTLDAAVETLMKAKNMKLNACLEFNGQKLYSLYDTPDTCYLKVTGYTKKEHEKAMQEWRKDFEEKYAREEERAKKNVPVWFERGKAMIYPEKWEVWHKCVETRASDLYHGFDLENALDIMEALEKSSDIQEASKIFKDAGHSGMSASVVLRMVVNFSKRGPEFYRANVFGEITAETEKFLQEITKENEEFEKALKSHDTKAEIVKE